MDTLFSAVMRLLTSLIALTLLLSSSGYSHSVKAGSAPVAGPGGGAGPSPSSREALEAFIRQLDRAETLYQALMFEEADRVSEMSVMRSTLFLKVIAISAVSMSSSQFFRLEPINFGNSEA